MPHEEANSSKSSDEKRSGASPDISSDCAPSFFDDPSFFEDVVLDSSSKTGTFESEASTSERQRLIKQATQISQQLRIRLQELDRRESSMLALSAAFEAEQRAWRLTCRQHQEGLDARESRLDEREAEIESKARELGAWEQAITSQSQGEQSNLERLEKKLVAREQRFNQQLKSSEHKERRTWI